MQCLDMLFSMLLKISFYGMYFRCCANVVQIYNA
nr:MAG TPA: hypothetical protein [Caudoviricetes sp.]